MIPLKYIPRVMSKQHLSQIIAKVIWRKTGAQSRRNLLPIAWIIISFACCSSLRYRLIVQDQLIGYRRCDNKPWSLTTKQSSVYNRPHHRSSKNSKGQSYVSHRQMGAKLNKLSALLLLLAIATAADGTLTPVMWIIRMWYVHSTGQRTAADDFTKQ